jgi:hypothetical protein
MVIKKNNKIIQEIILKKINYIAILIILGKVKGDSNPCLNIVKLKY